ncbi:MAG: phosphotransferase [candidate division KSB1 bacterium]|nr:phosphotransferase [candidate division KSB1 bacterium]MDZ7273234.1 phosphotransferase [candidate division KSB1 bacterium]MDZ7285336.1 phosphotransferase [candidate division KSB1 bacterium]MDZ7298368.1 phosphotransferase [candidate division KSB1 bacterium]MDZ7309249.1 phosphotransferase [candidate division KSB1 bacterium]
MNEVAATPMAGVLSLHDRKLPGLRQALDPAAVRAWLLSRVPGLADAEDTPAITLLKYTPGKRCVLAYECGGAPRRRLIGKIYRHDRGLAVFDNMSRLWQVAQRSDPPFHMPRPLVYLPEWGMVVQEAAGGIRADHLLRQQTFAGVVQAAARNLAALHRLEVELPRRDNLAQHLLKLCHPGWEHLLADLPEENTRLRRIITHLLATHPRRSLGPVHGDLTLTQIFSNAGEVSFIDFDGLCHAPAALDVGNFLVALEMHLGPDSQPLRAAFLEQYDRLRPLTTLPAMAEYRALAYLRRAMIAWRQRPRHWRQRAQALLAAAEHALVHADDFLTTCLSQEVGNTLGEDA